MRTYDDTFSGEKIYPGKGKLYVRGDSKIFRFQNGKTESLFLQRKNPRRIAWTTLYRRQHKKGISEEVAKSAPAAPSNNNVASSAPPRTNQRPPLTTTRSTRSRPQRSHRKGKREEGYG
ncbi:hypothetical protein ABVK25_003450 [Lepraria finkii]|uniref:Large ribosomal subunit protein eL24-related N-terminal domain-containing protein n=1 Tax=Lepraria finkii TaxID=1340010 RepID=A0ABR4BEZ3_9LECA